MKIAVCLLSRSHPEALTGVVMGLWRLRTEKHQIEFRIGADFDDEPTIKAVGRLGSEIPPESLVIHCGPRPISRGEIENILIAHCKDADVVTLMTDRTFCITPGWDDMVARGVSEEKYRGRVFWWSCPQDHVCAIPIIPKAWLDACDYRWSPEIFPFWFDDTWNQHIDLLIHGMPSQKMLVSFSGTRGKTTRGRDFAFWINVFNECLPLRVTAAKEMAAKLGVAWQDRRDVLLYFENWSKALLENVSSLEQVYGDDRDPGPEYFTAKDRAEKMLIDMAAARAEVEKEAAE
jgi:hypothetical protein